MGWEREREIEERGGKGGKGGRGKRGRSGVHGDKRGWKVGSK